MKLILFLTIFIFSHAVIGQTVLNVIGNHNIYVYNNSKDTIILSGIKGIPFPFSSGDSLKVIDSIQIDGIGSKEIVIFRTCSGIIDEHGGTFDINERVKISKFEILNLDTKQIIFIATNSYCCNFTRFRANQTPPHTKGIASYSYDFKIDSTGKITISNLKPVSNLCKTAWKTGNEKGESKTFINEVLYNEFAIPEEKEGTYSYINGKYVLE